MSEVRDDSIFRKNSVNIELYMDRKDLDAEGIVYFRSMTNNGYSGDLEMALIPE